MVIFVGPPGSGKSVQGQILATRKGWRWLSMGQLLRDTHDSELFEIMQNGELVPDDRANQIIFDVLKRVPNIDDVILDGYPRNLDQAKWLIANQPKKGGSIGLAIALEVPVPELIKRLELRGRHDDTPDAINERLMTYKNEIYPILNYFSEHGIHIAHIDGTGTVNQIHDRIMKEINSCKLD